MTDNTAKSSAEIHQLQRNEKGHFLPGNGGRPVGSRNRISNEALASVKSMKDAAIQQLYAKLIIGDWQAILFVLERILPRGRTVELDDATPDAITAALTGGVLTVSEAKDAAIAMAKLSELRDLAELRERLEALERTVNIDAD